MQRRTLLKVGLLGSTLLAAAGGVAFLFKPAARDAATSDEARIVLRGVMPALLAGALPTDAMTRAAALNAALRRTLAAITDLPLPTRIELGELFMLLASPPGRWLAGVDQWETASIEQTSAFLQRWRTHSFDLFQVGYHALHDLILGPYYSDPSTWEAIGYPGPMSL